MTTTGTYGFNPAGSDLVLSAFARIGIRRTEITAQHMVDADRESNLTQVEISNRVPNLWANELYTQVLTAGTAAYTLPSRLVAFQVAYITTTLGGVSTDRLVYAYSAFEYGAIPNKTQQAPPTSYYLNTVVPPEITFWPVPDDNATYTFKARILRQIQDTGLSNGTTIEMPYRWLDVFVAKLACRLARIYAPDREAMRKQDAAEAWSVAATTDQEQVPMYILPTSISSYWG